MSKPKAPTPPDPKATAAAQTGTNVSTAIANQALGITNQVTPFGSLTHNQTGSYQWTDPTSGQSYTLPQYTATQTLSPEQQAILDQQNRANLNLSTLGADQAGRLGGLLGQGIDMSGIPAGGNYSNVGTPYLATMAAPPKYSNSVKAPKLDTTKQAAPGFTTNVKAPTLQSGGINAPKFGADLTAPEYNTKGTKAPKLATSYVDDFSQDRQRVEDALMKRLDPYLQLDRARLDNQLVNQGIRVGSTARDAALDESNRQANDARLAAILGAGTEQSRLAGLARDQATFGNTARQQTFDNQFGLMSYGNDMLSRGLADQQGIQARADTLGQQTFQNQRTLQSDANTTAQQNFANQFQVQGYGNQQQQQDFENRQSAQTAFNATAQQGFQNQFGLQQSANDTRQLSYQDARAQEANAAAYTQQTFQNEMTIRNQQDAARQRALQEQYAQRAQPINEIAALMGGSQIQQPSFVNTSSPTIPTTDYAGLINQNFGQQQQIYQQQMAQRNAMLGGLFGLGGAAIMA